MALSSGAVTGVEALARWPHAVRGPIAPAEFVPLAERSGLIDALTEWVIRTALRQWGGWRAAGLRLNLAFNLSAQGLDGRSFPDLLAALCRGYGVPPSHVTVELTESGTQDAPTLLDALSRLRTHGFGVSMDDFGMGYSSLARLQRLPFTQLKIDKSFASAAAARRDCRIIVTAIIDLAHQLGLSAVAEGVEDQVTLDLLRELGCDEAQGYHIARPMSGDAIPAWCDAWRGLAEPRAARQGR